jgi:hypothetical protein
MEAVDALRFLGLLTLAFVLWRIAINRLTKRLIL